MLAILTVKRLKQAGSKFEASLGYLKKQAYPKKIERKTNIFNIFSVYFATEGKMGLLNAHT